jgi:hypothetical protein
MLISVSARAGTSGGASKATMMPMVGWTHIVMMLLALTMMISSSCKKFWGLFEIIDLVI